MLIFHSYVKLPEGKVFGPQIGWKGWAPRYHLSVHPIDTRQPAGPGPGSEAPRPSSWTARPRSGRVSSSTPWQPPAVGGGADVNQLSSSYHLWNSTADEYRTWYIIIWIIESYMIILIIDYCELTNVDKKFCYVSSTFRKPSGLHLPASLEPEEWPPLSAWRLDPPNRDVPRLWCTASVAGWESLICGIRMKRDIQKMFRLWPDTWLCNLFSNHLKSILMGYQECNCDMLSWNETFMVNLLPNFDYV